MKTIEAVQQIKDKFPDSILSETVFLGETTLEVSQKDLKAVLGFLKPTFEVLMDLTGVDFLQPTKRTQVLYWLHNPTNLDRIRIIVYAERDESIPSVTDLWEGADWYERELFDLFGVHFHGHPHLTRILMPDDWVGHPLRRDYALTEESVEFKHGVIPKIPSQIISHGKNIQKA
jgi:NADH-quinone oxidoreductase subunit C